MGSFSQLNYHVVFATKYRKPAIAKTIQESVYKYIGGIIRDFQGSLDCVGGIEDHVHLLVSIPPKIAVSDAIRSIKSNSSRWVNEQEWSCRNFEWQKGYGAFTVSYSQMDHVRAYIVNQELHHRKLTFQEEYIDLLRKHNLHFELKYLFEDEHNG